jgi:hypothetical protein
MLYGRVLEVRTHVPNLNTGLGRAQPEVFLALALFLTSHWPLDRLTL